MGRQRFTLVVVTTVLAAICLARNEAHDAQRNQDVPEIVEAAEGALRTTQAEYDLGQAKVEDIYRWSRRLMKEELKHGSNKNAKGDHVRRMLNLFQKAEALYKHGARGGTETNFHATRYYYLKAKADAKLPDA